MKMFVWRNPYPVVNGNSVFIAVAESEEEARQLGGTAYTYGEYEKMRPHSHKVPTRTPDRVIECPCAEWGEWA